MKKAVILLSGGLDSATTLAIAQNDGFTPYGLTFSYGQRHQFEIGASQKIAEACNLTDHIITEIDLRAFGGSALTDDIDVPKDRSESTMGGSIPVTYVPARNTIFLSFALAWAEVLQSNDIFLGVNSMDYSGYPDCRPEYIQSFQAMANLATKAGVDGDQSITIHTPLISMTKGEIIKKGLALGVDYSLTHSCYDPDKAGNACGRCDSCCIRLKGFQEAGTADPINYT
ncbi:MAG TPA: 7-cyano-7-deazaguanine synthase QueC [Candidatus Marinimicrobia bacterium]|jgi:7-cyano-7-deazaguanine synthase|nr:7-cyano-7-deazaguanine synthase QueC [Candidatus Neomarinimicrobiota bacterium]MDP6142825.1 7-cyano-7-deazaguanine synthase QueC [Candidatus Neomarinimicrobiota bacterium]MDP6261139.1 7-cyano-7-deazaguanine synthase QueC [Candidatus Neomarinimicrobiota bacterium]MDP7127277.1 7-cyano-7-deazaguanine synthase QueC [Candidatus Neomarinimicrobiota bacterium]MDP7337333.1 7-cyano-7-deazaguanine synthase QueC [Candidatus Neomarinimicrobiota bacterium]|tara:strand:+ start:3201 stop:3884 length:684 start_codon:yes stop_codon:yes gene_type:complete